MGNDLGISIAGFRRLPLEQGSNLHDTTLINEAPPSHTALTPRLTIAEVFEPFNPDEEEYPFDTPDIYCTRNYVELGDLELHPASINERGAHVRDVWIHMESVQAWSTMQALRILNIRIDE